MEEQPQADLVEQERIDIIGNVPYEVSIRILSYLRSAIQLSRLALLNSRFKKLANDDLLWKELCRLKWRKKRHMVHELHPLVDYSHLISSLTIKEMKGILALRHVNYKILLEKSEFIQSVLTTLPTHAPKGKWSGKWKSSYIVALLDSTRTKLTTEELCSFDWNFHFLGHWLHPPQHNRSRFNRDKTYESDILERAMHWRWYDGRIQVDQYDALTIGRTPEWGWTLTNEQALLISIDDRFTGKEEDDYRKRAIGEAVKKSRIYQYHYNTQDA